MRKDVLSHGPTRDCLGCRALMNNRFRGDSTGIYGRHSEDCRMRFAGTWDKHGDPRNTRLVERTYDERMKDISEEVEPVI